MSTPDSGYPEVKSGREVSPRVPLNLAERREAIALYEEAQRKLVRTDDPIERVRILITDLVLKNGAIFHANAANLRIRELA